MEIIKIKNVAVSKSREKKINDLYAQIFSEMRFPDTDEMRVYENMRMINADELIQRDKAALAAQESKSDKKKPSKLKSVIGAFLSFFSV